MSVMRQCRRVMFVFFLFSNFSFILVLLHERNMVNVVE